MERKYLTIVEKSNKENLLTVPEDSFFDNEDLNTTCATIEAEEESKVPDVVNNLEQLPEVSATVIDMVNNGPNNDVYKAIYEDGILELNAEEIEMRKRLFECSLELWQSCKARKQREKEEAEKEPFRAKVLQEDYETSRMIKAVQRRTNEKKELISKTIEECKALIARYYKAIEDFDNHMLNIRDDEIRRMVLEGTKEEQAQCNSLVEGVVGKPKSKLHQLYVMKAKQKL